MDNFIIMIFVISSMLSLVIILSFIRIHSDIVALSTIRCFWYCISYS